MCYCGQTTTETRCKCIKVTLIVQLIVWIVLAGCVVIIVDINYVLNGKISLQNTAIPNHCINRCINRVKCELLVHYCLVLA